MKLNEVKEFVKELRGLSRRTREARKRIEKELFELRFQAATGQLEQTARLKEVKNKSLVSKQFNLKRNNRLGKEKFQWNAIIVKFLLDVLYLTKWTRQSQL